MKLITVKLEVPNYLQEVVFPKISETLSGKNHIALIDPENGTYEAAFKSKEMQNLDHPLYIKLEKIAEMHHVGLEYRISNAPEIVTTDPEEMFQYSGTFSPRAKYGME